MAVAVGVALHLVGLGLVFSELIGGLLTLAVALGGLALMMFQKKALPFLGLAVVLAIGLLVIPPMIAEAIRGLPSRELMLVLLKVVVGLALAAGVAAALGAAVALTRRLLRGRRRGLSSLASLPLRPSPVRRPRGPRERGHEE